MVMKLLWVCAGGALGSGARYLLALVAQRMASPLPLGTLIANVLGSFILALLLQAFDGSRTIGEGLRLALTTGAMGGFTTYSTFNYESLGYLQRGEYLLGIVYIALTGILCLVGGGMGFWLGKSL